MATPEGGKAAVFKGAKMQALSLVIAFSMVSFQVIFLETSTPCWWMPALRLNQNDGDGRRAVEPLLEVSDPTRGRDLTYGRLNGAAGLGVHFECCF